VRNDAAVLGVIPCTTATGPGILPGLSEPDYLFSYDGNQAAVELPADKLYPVLFCGAVRGYSNRLLIREGLDRATRILVLSCLLEAVREWARREAAMLIVFGFLPVHDVQELLAVDNNLSAVFNEVESVLGPVESYAGYLSNLNQRQRYSTNRETRRFAANGLRMERRPLREVFEPVVDIVTQHERKFDSRVTHEEIREDLGRYLSPGLEERTRVFCAMQGESLLGTSLSVAHGRTYNVRLGGVHPHATRDAAVYFNCIFYAPIRTASEDGATYLSFGMNTIEAKILRGCRAHSLWAVLDTRADWTPESKQRLHGMAKIRFDLTRSILRKHQSEQQVSEDLGDSYKLPA